MGYEHIVGYAPGVGAGYPRQVEGYPQIVGATVLPALHPGAAAYVPHPQPTLQLPPQPSWRQRAIGPGIEAPAEGHVPVVFVPEANNGVLISTGPSIITFTSKPQKPFKLTRLLEQAVKTGATATGIVQGQMFCGTDLEQGELGFISLEGLGAANAFDTWLAWKQSTPGVLLRIQVTASLIPTSPDNIAVTLSGLGHYVH